MLHTLGALAVRSPCSQLPASSRLSTLHCELFALAHKMKQNGASFCRARFPLLSIIRGPVRTASAHNGRIMSLPSVLRAVRPKSNVLHRKEMRCGPPKIARTKPQKTSSTKGFCHFARTSAQTKWAQQLSASLALRPPLSTLRSSYCGGIAEPAPLAPVAPSFGGASIRRSSHCCVVSSA